MIVNVHFVRPTLFAKMIYSLGPRGYLYCETFGGHGKNYIDLPIQGHWKNMLEPWLKFEFYQEKRVGPPDQKAVSVKLLAQKRDCCDITKILN